MGDGFGQYQEVDHPSDAHAAHAAHDNIYTVLNMELLMSGEVTSRTPMGFCLKHGE
jgi:hypothetical protein